MSTLAGWLLVALGAGIGSAVRYAVSTLGDRDYPLGTLAVNTVGSFGLGAILGANLGQWWWLGLGVGFCGGLTTYSTFAWQLLELPRRRAWGYGTVTVSLGVLAGWAGFSWFTP